MKNRICLWFAMYFLSKVDVKRADKEAQWDDAQDYIESFAYSGNRKGPVEVYRKLHRQAHALKCLMLRAIERADDIRVEEKMPTRTIVRVRLADAA